MSVEHVEYKVELPDFGVKQFFFMVVVVPLLISSPLLAFVALYELGRVVL